MIRCYFIDLMPKTPTGDQMHLVYQQKECLIEGEENVSADWEVLIRAGPWWDGTKPLFILPDSSQLPKTNDHSPHGVWLSKLTEWYAPECIWIAAILILSTDEHWCGSFVCVQRADARDEENWHVWQSPTTDKDQVLQTPADAWFDHGWCTSEMCAQLQAEAEGLMVNPAQQLRRLIAHQDMVPILTRLPESAHEALRNTTSYESWRELFNQMLATGRDPGGSYSPASSDISTGLPSVPSSEGAS